MAIAPIMEPVSIAVDRLQYRRSRMLHRRHVGPSRSMLGLDGHLCRDNVGVGTPCCSFQYPSDFYGLVADVFGETALQALEDPLDLFAGDWIHVARCNIVADRLEAAQQLGALLAALPQPLSDRWSTGKVLKVRAQGRHEHR